MIPNNGFTPTPQPNEFETPYDYPYGPNVCFAWGGLAINNPTQGRNYQVWVGNYVNGAIQIAPVNGAVQYTKALSNATQISFAFDNNMSPIICWQDGNNSYIYFFNVLVNQYETLTLGSTTSIRCVLDDQQPFYNADSDVIAAYMRDGFLYYRQQRDRFGIERLIGPVFDQEAIIVGLGLNVKNRLQVELWSAQNAIVYAPDPVGTGIPTIFSSTIPLPIAKMTWDFGDGTVVDKDNPTTTAQKHVYAKAGTYTVKFSFRLANTGPLITYSIQLDVFENSTYTDIPVDKLNMQQWSNLVSKNITSSFPLKFYDDGQYPLKTVSVWPIPEKEYDTTLWLWAPLEVPNDLDSEINFPPGYERALKFALAQELAPEFGKQVPPQVSVIARNAKQSVRRLNQRDNIQRVDFELMPDKPYFNYVTGDTIRPGGNQ